MTDQTINLEIFCHPERPELVRPFSIDDLDLRNQRPHPGSRPAAR